MALAPVVLFVYNRPWHTRKTLEALAKNDLADQSKLYVYADGAKENATAEDLKKIQEVHEIVNSRTWCGEQEFIKRNRNLGLADNIVDGVTTIVNRHGRIIVLEDDLVTSRWFIGYMNDSLANYSDVSKVLSIGACNFFTRGARVPDTFFLPIPDCWGWGTWKDRWELFEPDSNKLIEQLSTRKLIDEFNLDGDYDFFGMLEDQRDGKVNSWAIRWQAVAYLSGKLSLYPKYTMTINIGDGEEATHGTDSGLFHKVKLARRPVILNKATNIAVDQKAYAGFKHILNNSTQVKSVKFMNMRRIKSQLIKLTPPKVRRIYHRFMYGTSVGNETSHKNIMWRGDYKSWQEAQAITMGYDSDAIFEKTAASILKVKNGEAVYERDSVLFNKPEYSWPLLAIFSKIAIENHGSLNILDFGGSLGSSYFQNRNFLSGIDRMFWSVVEQEHYIDYGNKNIADERLKFYHTIDECIKDRNPTVLLLSGVIQYLKNPYEWLEKFISRDFTYIIFDRTPFIDSTADRLTVQEVPEYIYKASYPAWFFNFDKFVEVFNDKYDIIADFDSHHGFVINFENEIKGYYKGLILKRKVI